MSRALRLLRVYHKLSLTQLSKKIDVSVSFLSEIESGKKNPTVELLGKYGQAFDMPVSAILSFSDEIDNPSSSALSFSVRKKVLDLLEWLSDDEEVVRP